MSIVYLNGTYLPMEQAKISPMDRGFLFGDGIYEVIPSYGGRLVGFNPHMQRMQDGLDASEIQLRIDRGAWREIAANLIERNGGDEDIEVADDDPVLDEARQLASRRNRVSPSLLQRRLNVGYAKAEQLIARLEDEGIVGPREDGESRRVLVATASDPDSGGL